jgi:hypothetical protein
MLSRICGVRIYVGVDRRRGVNVGKALFQNNIILSADSAINAKVRVPQQGAPMFDQLFPSRRTVTRDRATPAADAR